MILLKFFLLVTAIALPAASLFSSAITPGNIISLTNASRDGLELPKLKESELLDASAQKKAEDMLKNQYFAHTSPAGVSPWSWIKSTGYTYRYAGENLAVYFTEAEDVQAGWMASPTHRANIVDTRYTEIGVGVAQGEYNGYPATFVVQHFGKPTETAKMTESEATPQAEPPAIAVVPTQDTYKVAVKEPDATAVTVQLGNTSTALTKINKETWQGEIPVEKNTLSKAGEPLTVVLSETDGEQRVEQAAVVAPEANAQDMYAFEAKTPKARIFGMTLDGLKDSVTQLYIIGIIVLSTLVIITVAAKAHWNRIPLAAHAFAVIMLAVILMAI